MSIEIPMRRENGHLVPADSVSAEMMAEIPLNTGLMVEVRVPRNLRQFRLAWALASIVSKSVDYLPDRETAMDWLKIKARHVRMIIDPKTGEIAIIPKSIAYASLEQTAFARVLNRMVYVTITDIIPGMQESELRAELEKIVGIEPDKPKRKSQPKGGDGEKPPEPLPHSESIAPAADRPLGPTNGAEYLKACRAWIEKQRNQTVALDYYDSAEQIALRVACKISVGENKSLRRELLMHFEKDVAK
jgi:hypothetical protein